MNIMSRNDGCLWYYEQPPYRDNLREGNTPGQCPSGQAQAGNQVAGINQCCYSWDPCRCCCQVPWWCGYNWSNDLEPEYQNNHPSRCKCDSDINIYNSIQIKQEAEANGGNGGDGGDGGNAKGGNAAAASAEAENGGDVEAIASINSQPYPSHCYGRPLESLDTICARAGANGVGVNNNANDLNNTEAPTAPLTPLNNGLGLELGASVALGDAAAAGGSASGGDGGDAGAGGAGGTNAQTATASIENVIVINCDGNNGPPGLRLNQNDRTIDIKMDKDGNTLVNGEKMDETTLENGSKVLIVRSSEVKKSPEA